MKYTLLPTDGKTIGEVGRGEGRTSIASSSYVRRGKTRISCSTVVRLDGVIGRWFKQDDLK
jgi:hypothetical protein